MARRTKTINSPVKIFLSLWLVCISLVITSCGSVTIEGGNMSASEKSDPSADEVFEEFYHTITVAMATNGYGPQFRWKNEKESFPYEQASWADMTSFMCGNDWDRRRLDLMATTFDQGLGSEKYQERVEKVKTAWEAMGLTVRRVGASEGGSEIAVTLSHGSVVTYMASLKSESITAETPCLAEFAGDKSTATVFPAKYSP